MNCKKEFDIPTYDVIYLLIKLKYTNTAFNETELPVIREILQHDLADNFASVLLVNGCLLHLICLTKNPYAVNLKIQYPEI